MNPESAVAAGFRLEYRDSRFPVSRPRPVSARDQGICQIKFDTLPERRDKFEIVV